MLAGMPQAPSDYSPVRQPERARRRAATRSWARWPSSAMITRERPQTEMAKGLGLHMERLLRAAPASATCSTT